MTLGFSVFKVVFALKLIQLLHVSTMDANCSGMEHYIDNLLKKGRKQLVINPKSISDKDVEVPISGIGRKIFFGAKKNGACHSALQFVPGPSSPSLRNTVKPSRA
jgi:hypothetical protein